MSKSLSAFCPVPGLSGIYTAEKGNLRCTAVRLVGGGLCLYSPVQGLGDEARESLVALGPVTHLLAPNHYHHKGLAEYAAAFPKAIPCAPEAALSRLETQTGVVFTPLADAGIDLPAGSAWVTPEGLKTGEVWLDQVLPDGRLWIVTDAFCGPKTHKTGFADAPELLGTFPIYGIADSAIYRDWLASALQSGAPTFIIPCHGAMIGGNDLASKTLELVAGLT